MILSQKVCAGRSRTNVPTSGYNIQSLFRILPQHTVALRCAKSLELPQNGFLRGNQSSIKGQRSFGVSAGQGELNADTTRERVSTMLISAAKDVDDPLGHGPATVGWRRWIRVSLNHSNGVNIGPYRGGRVVAVAVRPGGSDRLLIRLRRRRVEDLRRRRVLGKRLGWLFQDVGCRGDCRS